MADSAIRFTVERRERLVELVKSGMTQVEACAELKLSKHTLNKWLRRGRGDSSGEYFEFARAYDEARPSRRRQRPSELVKQERAGGLDVPTLVALLEAEALNGNVQAIKYLLERPWERKDAEEVKPQGKSILDELSALRDRKNAG